MCGVGTVAMWTPTGSPVCCGCLRWVEPRFWWCKLQVLIEQLGFWLAAVVKTPVLFWKLARMDFLTMRGKGAETDKPVLVTSIATHPAQTKNSAGLRAFLSRFSG